MFYNTAMPKNKPPKKNPSKIVRNIFVSFAKLNEIYLFIYLLFLTKFFQNYFLKENFLQTHKKYGFNLIFMTNNF